MAPNSKRWCQELVMASGDVPPSQWEAGHCWMSLNVVGYHWTLLNVIGSFTPVWHCAPVYPTAQVQLYPLTPSMQVPPFWHGAATQSSMSVDVGWLVHVHKEAQPPLTPFPCRPVSHTTPVYPTAQAQLYSSTPSTQVPPF